MAGIPLTELGRGVAVRSAPWAKSPVTLKRASFPKGTVPPHLRGYVERFPAVARQCAAEARGLTGEARIRKMNACVSARLGR